MIKVTTDVVDGVRFITSVSLLEPDDTIYGLPVYLISSEYIQTADNNVGLLKTLGLRNVGYDPIRCVYLYAQYLKPYILIKIVQLGLSVYLRSIYWLYENARMFQFIPPNSSFSWAYFTPYVWYRKLRGKH